MTSNCAIVMKQDNDVIYMIGCLQFVRIYSFMKEIKLNIRASYVVVLFVSLDNYNFMKEIKYGIIFRAFIAL